MMRRLLIPVLLLATACSKPVDVFYSTDYPVIRLEAEVAVTPDPDAGEEAEAEAAALAEAIRATVLREAPVEEGGSYRLDFNRADGGNLYVAATAGADPEAGSFTKVPAASELTFDYGEQLYTAVLSAYDNGGSSCIRFAVELTEAFRERLGNERIARVVRYEYTAHPRD